MPKLSWGQVKLFKNTAEISGYMKWFKIQSINTSSQSASTLHVEKVLMPQSLNRENVDNTEEQRVQLFKVNNAWIGRKETFIKLSSDQSMLLGRVLVTITFVEIQMVRQQFGVTLQTQMSDGRCVKFKILMNVEMKKINSRKRMPKKDSVISIEELYNKP